MASQFQEHRLIEGGIVGVTLKERFKQSEAREVPVGHVANLHPVHLFALYDLQDDQIDHSIDQGDQAEESSHEGERLANILESHRNKMLGRCEP